jgi:uncharacterized protein YehS (DUF1456 family)
MNKTSVDKGQRGLACAKVVKKGDFLAFFAGMNEISSLILEYGNSRGSKNARLGEDVGKISIFASMSNNDILRTLRYTFHYHDHKMKEIFALGGKDITFEEVALWLKKEEDSDFVKLYDKDLAHFLDGLIVANRGKKEGAAPVVEKTLNNNGILRKLKIALNLQDDGMLEIFGLRGFRLSKHELSAFFRNPSQAQYRECKDQVLRNFLMGLQEKYRGEGKSTT